MTHIKKILTTVLSLALVLLLALLCLNTVKSAKAETEQKEDAIIVDSSKNEEVTPYGLITKLTIFLDGGNGDVWATAKNTFTFFPAVVAVIVELYSSDTYADSYTSMTLEGRSYISDLDMGDTVVARASTNGVQKYWKGRMYFRIDSKDWQEKVTDTILCDANGIMIL